MKIYLVGGAVRDSLLNIPITDKDWVVVGGTKEILLKKKFQQVGKDFPVFLHPDTHEEYALARKERKLGAGHTNFDTDIDSKITLKEDLIRRDLTINAIAQDEKGNYIDPFNGQKDLQNRLLRHVSESFIEDPLRVLRTARFAASLMHLGFQIAKETILLMCSMVKNKELSYLTSNRIWMETEKAFKTLNPHVYFQVLYHCQALHCVFPEIYFLYEKRIFFSFNFSKNAYNNVFFFMGLSKISLLTQDISVRFAYLCQLISKENGFFFSKMFYDVYSSNIVKNLCNRLHVPSYVKEIAVLSTGFYFFLKNIFHQSSQDIINFFSKIDAWRKPDRIERFSILMNLHFSDENKSFEYQNNIFLKESFNNIKNISIQHILNRGFRGSQIRTELYRLRVKQLEIWRKNKKCSLKKTLNISEKLSKIIKNGKIQKKLMM